MLTSTYNRQTGDSGSSVLVRYQQTVGGVTVPAATGIAIHGGSRTIDGTTHARASHVRFVEQALDVHLRDATPVGQ
jgi:hypothetical protein